MRRRKCQAQISLPSRVDSIFTYFIAWYHSQNLQKSTAMQWSQILLIILSAFIKWVFVLKMSSSQACVECL